jgi:hypothetical protein
MQKRTVIGQQKDISGHHQLRKMIREWRKQENQLIILEKINILFARTQQNGLN